MGQGRCGWSPWANEGTHAKPGREQEQKRGGTCPLLPLSPADPGMGEAPELLLSRYTGFSFQHLLPACPCGGTCALIPLSSAKPTAHTVGCCSLWLDWGRSSSRAPSVPVSARNSSDRDKLLLPFMFPSQSGDRREQVQEEKNYPHHQCPN